MTPIEPTLANFRLYYPELNAVPDSTVLLYLDPEAFTVSGWGSCYGRAVLALTAHEVSLHLQRAANTSSGGIAQPSGVLQSGSEEGISFSFARATFTTQESEWLGSTPYGLMLAALSRRCQARAALSW